jgi:ribosome-binding factor A
VSTHKRQAWPTQRHYPRMARVNEVLREVLAEELELVAGSDSRLELVTVTAVNCEPDLRHATVLLASLPEPARAALGEARVRLQAAVARQVRMKRTPLLTFEADPAVAHGARVEAILRAIRSEDEARTALVAHEGGPGPDQSGGAGLEASRPGDPGGTAEPIETSSAATPLTTGEGGQTGVNAGGPGHGV